MSMTNISFRGDVYLSGVLNKQNTNKADIKNIKKYAKKEDCDIVVINNPKPHVYNTFKVQPEYRVVESPSDNWLDFLSMNPFKTTLVPKKYSTINSHNFDFKK